MARVEVVPYRESWPDEYASFVAELMPHIGDRIVRIDHIGATSIPGQKAKDIIDVQISVAGLTDCLNETLLDLGYRHHPDLKDNPPSVADADDWDKQVFTEPPDTRRFNIHVRRHRASNARQALLFRDYLRMHPQTASAHGRLKEHVSKMHPDDRDFYYRIKDSVFEIVMDAAEFWAAQTGWTVR